MSRSRKTRRWFPPLRRTEPDPIFHIQVINLRQTAQQHPIDPRFMYVSRIIWNMHFATNTIDQSLFGIDAALTKGIDIIYLGERKLPDTIKDNHDFAHYAYDTRIDSDAVAVKVNHLTSRWSFTKFTEGLGVRIDEHREMFIDVQDDLSGSSNTVIAAFVQGWHL